MHRLLADLARLALIDLADAADERALQVAEGVAAHALDAELVLDLFAQKVGERAGAGKLHVAVRVLLRLADELGDDRLALLVVDAFGGRDDAAPVLLVDVLHVGEELVDDEGALRQIDEMRAVAWIFARQRRGRGEEARVASHHDRAVDAGQRRVVEVGAGEGLRDEARRRRIAGHMVEADEVVVDRLRDMDGAERMPALLGLVGHDAHRVGGIVAADVEERVDLRAPSGP